MSEVKTIEINENKTLCDGTFDSVHNIAVINPKAGALDCADALTRRFSQSKALLSKILYGGNGDYTEKADQDLLWLLEAQLDEMNALFDAYWDRKNT